jgi:DNA-binding transcriptional ArsR family regulator
MAAHSNLEIEALNAVFSALSDPTRRAMLQRLSQGEASVNELAAPFKMSLPAVSKHIKVLEKAGLLTKTINAQQRPCKIDGAQLKQAVDWIEQYKQLWEARFDRMDAYLKELHVAETSVVATNNIAYKSINTPATAKNTSKKTVKVEKQAQKPPQTPKRVIQPQEKTNDNKLNDPANDLQQQIGFDF